MVEAVRNKAYDAEAAASDSQTDLRDRKGSRG